MLVVLTVLFSGGTRIWTQVDLPRKSFCFKMKKDENNGSGLIMAGTWVHAGAEWELRLQNGPVCRAQGLKLNPLYSWNNDT